MYQQNIKIYILYIFARGLEFQMLYEDIDFNCDSICCTIDNKDILIRLHDNNILNNAISDELNNENINETEKIYREVFCWTDASTKLFLSLYKENKDLIAQRKIKTKKILWQKFLKR